MNPFSTLFISLACIMLIQVSLGTYYALNMSKKYFIGLSIFNLAGQIVSLVIAIQMLNNELEREDLHCGLPQAALAFLGFGSLAVYFIVIIIQVSVRWHRKRRLNLVK